MVDIGYIALLLAFVVSLFTAVAAFLGGRRGNAELISSSRNGVYAVLALLTISSAALLYAFLTRDFSVEYVASYSSKDLSIPYTLAAFYAGNDGSLLFWSWTLSIFTTIVVIQNRRTNRELIPYVIAVVMVVQAFFILLMAFITNPFEKLPFAPADGNGLNPLLENPGMAFHPPTQLLGYMGFAVPFAFAIAALITRRLGNEWLHSIRRWTLVAWLFLLLGNFFGMVWAYTVLGWGGMWGWDPVENAGLMPFLTGTAFLHSVMIQRRRGMLKVWNIVLIIVTFNLSIFGTFLTRSGVLSSVHTFGQSALGPFFLGFIAVALIGSTILLFTRLDDLRSEDELDSVVSRESTFLLNNLILVGATFATFLGVVFPILSEWVRGVKITVGPPFYNQVNGPIFLLLILLMGICPLIGWRKATLNNFFRNFIRPTVAGLVLAIVLFLLGMRAAYALLAFAVCGFVLSTIGMEWIRGVRALHRTRGENYLRAFLSLVWGNKSRYGGYIVHVGIILIAIGIIGSMGFDVSKEVSLSPGESGEIGKYVLKYEDMDVFPEGSNKVVVATTLSVYNGEKLAGTVTPEKAFYLNSQQPISRVAIRTSPAEDLYVILSGWEEIDGVTIFQFIVNPLMLWVWIGGGVLMLGAIVAVWPERAKQIVRREE